MVDEDAQREGVVFRGILILANGLGRHVEGAANCIGLYDEFILALIRKSKITQLEHSVLD